MFLRMHVCQMYAQMHASMCVCVCVHEFACTFVRMCAREHVCMHVCGGLEREAWGVQLFFFHSTRDTRHTTMGSTQALRPVSKLWISERIWIREGW